MDYSAVGICLGVWTGFLIAMSFAFVMDRWEAEQLPFFLLLAGVLSFGVACLVGYFFFNQKVLEGFAAFTVAALLAAVNFYRSRK